MAQTGIVTLKVQVNTKTERRDRSESDNRQRTQAKSLEIELRNFSPVAYSNLTVKYYLFGEKLVSDKITPGRSGPISIAKSGEKTVTLPANGNLTITSDAANFTYTPPGKVAHGWTGDQVILQTTPGAGTRFIGHAVLVISGNKVIASEVEPRALATAIPELQQQPKPPSGILVKPQF
jgi:hypothetical protein